MPTIQFPPGLTPGAIGFNCGFNDDIHQPNYYRRTRPMSRDAILEYSDILWTRPSFPGQLATIAGLGFQGLDSAHQYWEWNWFAPTGAHVPNRVTGTSTDNLDNVLPNATVRLFNSVTGLQVDQQTSDAAGWFVLNDANRTNNNFVVSYLAGSPNTEGISDQGA